MMHISDWLPTFYSLGGGDAEDLGDIDSYDMTDIMTGYSIYRTSVTKHTIVSPPRCNTQKTNVLEFKKNLAPESLCIPFN